MLCEACGESGIPKSRTVDICDTCWGKHYKCVRGDCKSQWSDGEYHEFLEGKSLRKEIVMLRGIIAEKNKTTVELEELRIELIGTMAKLRSEPIPEMMDKHFKLHKNSVQFGLDRAVDAIDSVIEEAITNDHE